MSDGAAAIDWESLRSAAGAAARNAHAPYSRFPVGAAAVTSDGRLLVACNVENASYGLTLCAECGIVSALHAGGGGRLAAIVAVGGHGQLLAPCGRCRQLLLEHGGSGCRVLLEGGDVTVAELLPHGFGDADLRHEWERTGDAG